MSTKYSAPSVEAIQENSEDESRDGLRARDGQWSKEYSYHRSRSSMDEPMILTRANTGKERERPRRKHRSKEGGSKHQSRSQGKNVSPKKASGPTTRDSGSDGQRTRHRRVYSNRSSSSTSSSEEDEPVQDHREVLAAARAKLTSASMISTFTSLTNSTNKSSGSSGSNSTVTQASITKRSSLGKRSELIDAPLSPAVPDAPNVFAFLDNESVIGITYEAEEDEHEEGQEQEDHLEVEEEPEDGEPEDDEDEGHQSEWLRDESDPPCDTIALPPQLSLDHAERQSSSASSSFHGSDLFSEPAADNDTDRSTSPEQSIKDLASDHEAERTPIDRASARMASQMAAAQERQDLYGSMQNFGNMSLPRGNTQQPHITSTALSPRHARQVQHHPFPRLEKLPVTGYDLLATRLSSYSSSLDIDDGPVIKPMYRKFGALNHRLLLHLQDELSELEEQLHRLDHADTQSRWAGHEGRVVPASRRAGAMQGGDLQWHKTDILGKIGFKLAQYNQALSSFNTTQSLSAPDPTDVDTYREYLSTENPIAEEETRFLDPSDDLVSICSSVRPSAPVSHESSSQPLSRSESQVSVTPLKPDSIVTYDHEPQSQLQGLAVAIAVAVLIPILTFNVIPGFLGRITVVGLVASGVVFALIQAGVVGKQCFGREGLICGGIYGSVMIVLAGIIK